MASRRTSYNVPGTDGPWLKYIKPIQLTKKKAAAILDLFRSYRDSRQGAEEVMRNYFPGLTNVYDEWCAEWAYDVAHGAMTDAGVGRAISRCVKQSFPAEYGERQIGFSLAYDIQELAKELDSLINYWYSEHLDNWA